MFLYYYNLTGAFGQENLECFVAGVCDESFHLDASYVDDEFECLEQCKANNNCNWFSYSPQLAFCELLHNCSVLSIPECPDCLSGQVDCKIPEPQCWVQGQCKGNMIHFEEASTQEECLEICKKEEGCKWFTYYNRTRVGQSCVLFHDCPVLQDDCDGCVSGEKRCETASQGVLWQDQPDLNYEIENLEYKKNLNR